jgi:hypothetical protein
LELGFPIVVDTQAWPIAGEKRMRVLGAVRIPARGFLETDLFDLSVMCMYDAFLDETLMISF